MSGFEMHRFRTIDRDLTPIEKREIETWSSRVSPTSNGATFIYHYGSFKKDTARVFAKYFDAMLYVDNWGTTQLMFRFPKDLVNRRELSDYSNDYGEKRLGFYQKGDYTIMNLQVSEEESTRGWMEEEDFLLDPLLSIREEILNGDYRSLYLGWLLIEEQRNKYEDDGYDEDDDEDDEYERIIPKVPANLKTLTSAHKELIHIFEIDEKLVNAAASVSPNHVQTQPSYEQLIQQLSTEEKDRFLLQLVTGERLLDVKLRKKLDALVKDKRNINFGKALDWTALKELKK